MRGGVRGKVALSLDLVVLLCVEWRAWVGAVFQVGSVLSDVVVLDVGLVCPGLLGGS